MSREARAALVQTPPADALPEDWGQSWGSADRFLARHLSQLRSATEALATGLPLSDQCAEFGELVGSAGLREAPIHRWYYYKEGFSPLLPVKILERLGTAGTGVVLDPFAGVGTTLLALRHVPSVTQLLGCEYSPFAHFVASSKLQALELDVQRLRVHSKRLSAFSADGRSLAIPNLSSLRDERIFARRDLYDILGAVHAVNADAELTDSERAFFLLGVAAIVEDVSGVMKDGRALRIKNGRRRRRNSLTPKEGRVNESGVRAVLLNQWLAMIEDCEERAAGDAVPTINLVRGDARVVGELLSTADEHPVEPGSVGLAVFSPPYLNCIDYSEVYKLELWILGMVSDAPGFRRLREGTLRSHPSVAFPDRPAAWEPDLPVCAFVDDVTAFLEDNLPRRRVGTMVKQYFADMFEVYVQLSRLVSPGGSVACVVGNSTFSRRSKDDGASSESWRVPILTDVVLARLAQAAGFDEVEIWAARMLRPRNVSSASARESIVVARRSGHA